uniref:NADH:ubiquinone oxidoreductase complex assembly factor 8 n=1 Tax=Junco hyemalis TaxID=40217 RepID=A0A8C5IDL7_JUNHY
MSGRGVWLRARARLRRFPAALAACGDQAAAYGRCVAAAAAGPAELRRDACLQEFQALRECFARAVRPCPGPRARSRCWRRAAAWARPDRGSLQAKATPK